MTDFNYYSKFQSVPAYSFPKGSNPLRNNQIPGPGQYD